MTEVVLDGGKRKITWFNGPPWWNRTKRPFWTLLIEWRHAHRPAEESLQILREQTGTSRLLAKLTKYNLGSILYVWHGIHCDMYHAISLKSIKSTIISLLIFFSASVAWRSRVPQIPTKLRSIYGTYCAQTQLNEACFWFSSFIEHRFYMTSAWRCSKARFLSFLDITARAKQPQWTFLLVRNVLIQKLFCCLQNSETFCHEWPITYARGSILNYILLETSSTRTSSDACK